jgi:DNA-binding response OmpR family regulator
MIAKGRILGVDDHPTNLTVLEELFEGFELKLASSGEEALREGASFCPDIVLLDIMMPGIDGYEICRQMRRHPKLGQAKIIMVSAKAMISERLAGYKSGADDYITKPFNDEELLAKVKVFMRMKSAEEANHEVCELLQFISDEADQPLKDLTGRAEMLMSNVDENSDRRRSLARQVYASACELQEVLASVQRAHSAMKAMTAKEKLALALA